MRRRKDWNAQIAEELVRGPIGSIPAERIVRTTRSPSGLPLVLTANSYGDGRALVQENGRTVAGFYWNTHRGMKTFHSVWGPGYGDELAEIAKRLRIRVDPYAPRSEFSPQGWSWVHRHGFL